MAKIVIEPKDIVEYFDNMDCSDCPFSSNCDIVNAKTGDSLCHFIMTISY